MKRNMWTELNPMNSNGVLINPNPVKGYTEEQRRNAAEAMERMRLRELRKRQARRAAL